MGDWGGAATSTNGDVDMGAATISTNGDMDMEAATTSTNGDVVMGGQSSLPDEYSEGFFKLLNVRYQLVKFGHPDWPQYKLERPANSRSSSSVDLRKDAVDMVRSLNGASADTAMVASCIDHIISIVYMNTASRTMIWIKIQWRAVEGNEPMRGWYSMSEFKQARRVSGGSIRQGDVVACNAIREFVAHRAQQMRDAGITDAPGASPNEFEGLIQMRTRRRDLLANGRDGTPAAQDPLMRDGPDRYCVNSQFHQYQAK